MDFDEDMSGLQIEDLGEYFQTDMNDNWKGFSLGYTDEEYHNQAQQQQQQQTFKHSAGSNGSESSSLSTTASEQHFTSPPLSSISEMFKPGNGLGDDLDFVSPRKDLSTLFQTEMTSASAKSDAALMTRSAEEAMELMNFCLDQQKKPSSLMVSEMAATKGTAPLSSSISPVVTELPRLPSQSTINSDDKDATTCSSREANMFQRSNCDFTVPCDPSICSTIGSSKTVSLPSPTLDDDRCFRKKSREKLRRQEVNVKFDELVELLGLSNRVRKSGILQEAVSTIKTLKRERDELRSDRDRLQQEVSKLATCLQYSHLGSMAAVNAVAMTQQLNQQLPHSNSTTHHHLNHQQHQQQQVVHTHPLNISCNPGTNCFPLSSDFSNISSQLGSHGPSTLPVSGHVTIAPKPLKLAPSTSIIPDTEMK